MDITITDNKNKKVVLKNDPYDASFPYALGVCRNGWQTVTVNIDDELAEMIVKALRCRKITKSAISMNPITIAETAINIPDPEKE